MINNLLNIQVTVEKILYDKANSAFKIFLARDEKMKSQITCKGEIDFNLEVDDLLDLQGNFVEYKGQIQFAFESAKVSIPENPIEQLKYVCKRTLGIGEKRCEEILKLKGDDWRNLKLGEVKISQEVYDNFQIEIIKMQNNLRFANLIAYLESHGLTANLANKAVEKWKDKAVEKVNENCYNLTDLDSCSFRIVDEKIRHYFDIADDDKRRIKSAILYAFRQENSDGSTVINCHVHLYSVRQLLPNVADNLIIANVTEMLKTEEIKLFKKANLIALKSDYNAEKFIYDYAKSKCENEAVLNYSNDDITNSTAIEFQLDQSQIDAVKFALQRDFAIINGGAGVGKTTIIKIIYSLLKKENSRINLATPTGKASARLSEATKISATTIHSLLKFDGREFKAPNFKNEILIIDESSMIDIYLFAEIVKRTPKKLILVGDQAQLPPVGLGQPFHDLINLLPQCVKTLDKCYRNKEAIFKAAMQIRKGEMPSLHDLSDNEEFTVVNATDAETIQTLLCEWQKKGEIDFEQDIILVPKNGKFNNESKKWELATVNSINAEMLNLERVKNNNISNERFSALDRVINTQNDPDLQIWNGTTGTIKAVENGGTTLYLKLDIPTNNLDTVSLNKESIKKLDYAYCLTTHKSQGSQYRKVFILCLSRDKFMLNRELIYTAVTRAKKKCYVIGDAKILWSSIQKKAHKNTSLQIEREV